MKKPPHDFEAIGWPWTMGSGIALLQTVFSGRFHAFAITVCVLLWLIGPALIVTGILRRKPEPTETK